MRIVCPDCSAAYEVPESLLSPVRRMVRCTRCGRQWQPASDRVPGPMAEDEAPLPSPAVPASFHLPSPDPRTPIAVPTAMAGTRPPELREIRLARAGWAATVLVLAAAMVAAYTWRTPIQAAWPPIQRAYLAIGLS